ncbi:increased DNA methylation 1-like isoform X2 [Lotus japonicus]|nr:increased DNA methylation 1-like isoform X2 [Lotus japonicus]XP_057415680.1 increased DNA methylation 1-like isoform X2 [Lotus japonicus]XP_057415681.1 increased DNA methylation 1-like isoform X2 [Lotus japonicus]XP_057415682.1 increased DNA methylation 1-like isoform X2 [Lotus japonicus]
MAGTNSMRHRKQDVNYADRSNHESDEHSSDPDYSRGMRQGGRKKRKSTRGGQGFGGAKTRSSSQRAMQSSGADLNARYGHGRRGEKTTVSTTLDMETQMVDLINVPFAEMVEPSLDSVARHGASRGQGGNSSSTREMETELVDSGVVVTDRNAAQSHGQGGKGHRHGGHGGGQGGQRCRHGTKSPGSQQREADGKRNKETGNPGPSSIVKKGPSSSEGQAINVRRGSPLPLQARSCQRTILSWLIDREVIKEFEQVDYFYGSEQVPNATGLITRGGILCNCCQREISVWTFEKHAGSELGEPYEHMYLPRKDENTCLQDLLITAWLNANEIKLRCPFSYVPKENAAEQNDGACSICGDGGDLISCDTCPSTYHSLCISKRVPHSGWLCPYCICKYCRRGEESKELVTCSQCDKKFHWGCLKHYEKKFSEETLGPGCTRLYCGPGCRQIYEKLENSLRIRNDISESYSWRVIHPKAVISASRNAYLENNLKVAVTSKLMDEAFATIIDKKTGIDVVQSIAYSRGANLRRVDFSRFYTFVLEKDDAILAAASIRFHGRGMAEMPFIATDKAYRCQGICRLLMKEIESFLCSLQVKTLVIPSVPENVEMWTQKFIFNLVNEVSREIKKEISSHNILTFPRTMIMYKDLCVRTSDVIQGADDQVESQNDEEPLLALQTEVHEPQREQAERSHLDLNVEPLQDC